MPRFSLVDAAVRALTGSAPACRLFVPGRIEVFGKHTDYAGGRSLVAAVPRGFAVAAAPAADRHVTIVDAVAGDRFDCPLDPLPDGASGWRTYALAVVRRLASNFPDAELSARIVFASSLPRAAGISSSSALVVGLSEALIARARLTEAAAWRDAIHDDQDRAAYFGCIENGASFGALAGDIGVGTHGGSEDHAAIVMSRAGELRQFAFSPLRLERVVAMPPGWTFVVTFSGVHAAKAGERQADYNRLASACTAIVSRWREQHPDDGRSLGALARNEALAGLRLPGELAARLEHFVAEDARVAEAADAFARGDIARVGELAAESHEAAARLLGNQVPETDALVELAGGRGAGASPAPAAAAASAFGGGWGGSAWALVRTTDAAPFLEHWLGAYRARYPQHPVTGFISPPSDGVIRA